jgi:uncharacterized membrane protein
MANVAVLGITSANSQSPKPAWSAFSETFLFRVCSQQDVPVFIAVRFNADGSNFMTHGWWIIERGTCQDIADFRKGEFYVYAQTYGTNPIKVFVTGSDLAKMCVKLPENFTYSAMPACDPGERRDFSRVFVTSDMFTWSL